ncbi:MAG TPA: type II toxin-antitoxin system RelE/ParE family toxin [Cyclobacteriaceae bacterium]|nr:type II toxin-antitoxin system RelE/ParE family toxin [Cyclobacteriaceae bacterium]
MEKVRQIIFYKDYFLNFYNDQTDKVKDKIEHVLYVITVAERIPKKFFEHITGTDGLYEVRVEFQGNIYRIFSCFDEGHLIVLFNGFQKKSQKTPPREIEKALKIKAAYFIEKLKSKGHGSKK